MSQSSATESPEEVPTELIIKPNHHCQGTTKKGEPCKHRVKSSVKYCKKHVSLFKYPKPTECPYCCESSNSCDMSQPLSCGHWMCRGCMLRWKTECPVCRRQLQVTKRDRKVMEHNTPITSEDQEEANMQAAIQVFLSELDGMRQEGREPGEMSDAYWGMMGEEENEVDLLSALIIGQAISNIRRRPRRALARPTTPAIVP